MTTADHAQGLFGRAFFGGTGPFKGLPSLRRRVFRQILSGLMDCLFMVLFMVLTVMVTLAWGG